jgi:glycolate oxidase
VTYPTIVFDATDETAKEHVALAFTDIMELAISLGGTITREHSVRRLKKALLPIQLGPRVTETKQVKRSSRPADPLKLRSSVAEFVLEVDPYDLVE